MVGHLISSSDNLQNWNLDDVFVDFVGLYKDVFV